MASGCALTTVDDEFDPTQGLSANIAYERYPIMTYAGWVSHLEEINRTGRIQPVGGVICSNMQFSLDSDPLGIPCQLQLSLGDAVTFSLSKETGSWNEPVFAFHIVKAPSLNAALHVQQKSLDIARPLLEQKVQAEREAREKTERGNRAVSLNAAQQVQQQSLEVVKPLWEQKQTVNQERQANKEETEGDNREVQKLGDRGAL